MKFAIGSDHAGFSLKERLKAHLIEKGNEVVDLGTHSEESVDYPAFGFAVAEAVSRGDAHRGLLVCGTGLGMSYVANKVVGIRAALCTSEEMAEMTAATTTLTSLSSGVGPPTLKVRQRYCKLDSVPDLKARGTREGFGRFPNMNKKPENPLDNTTFCIIFESDYNN